MSKTRAKRGKSSGSHDFSRIPSQSMPRSVFNRSHGLKTTFDANMLIPIYCDEALPGDTISLKMNTFGRMNTPLAAVLDNLHLDVFFYAVPNRILWTNWARFLGEQDDPGDSTDFLIPQITAGGGGVVNSELHDYLGIPPDVPNITFSALPARAYQMIWNHWYRSQDLQDSVVINMGDGPDSASSFVLLPRNKRHDYFTSALPFVQKGDPVNLPLGGYADVVSAVVDGGSGQPRFTGSIAGSANTMTFDGTATRSVGVTSGAAMDGIVQWADTELVADLSSVDAVTINVMREAFALQRLYEKDARGGTRLPEVLQSHFGVTNPDFRMQRPEYLGGGSTRININPVAQTSATSGGGVLGEISAYATWAGGGHGFTKSFSEHCVVIGMVNVRADLSYQQGLAKMWSRQTRVDFYWPSFAGLGEQAILNKEIYLQGAAGGTDDDDVFGYIPRHDEYRYAESRISGKMRSSASGSLDLWHLAQDFSALPVLNDSFIKDEPPIDRIVAVPSEPAFRLDAWFDIKHVRPMPTHGVPGMIDHF